MKQRVIVQGIIQKGEEILLLRRSQGGPGLIGKYELPGGGIDDGEQPEDAIYRHVYKDVGLKVGKPSLFDVLSINSREDVKVQYILLVYSFHDLGNSLEIKLGKSYDSYLWASPQKLINISLRDSAQRVLGINSANDTENRVLLSTGKPTNHHTDWIVVYSDGGSRGNPGPSAAAFVILNSNQEVIGQGGSYLGITTNNQAEYQGVKLGLESALKLGVNKLEFRIDSMLVVNQLKGLYKIKNRELWPINERIQELVKEFDDVEFNHVPRELNQLADSLVNKLLDEHQRDTE